MPVTGHYQISTGPLAAHVDVQEGEETFQELVRTLPTLSQISAVSTSSKDYKTAHSTSSRNLHDEEKGGEKVFTEDTEQPFDLHEYLTSSNDANQAAGVKHKHVSVTWKDLEISVVGGENRKIYIPTFGDVALSFFIAPFVWLWSLSTSFFPKKKPSTRIILHRSSGVVKPGEMCLVLGLPGSGCTSFLKAIANHKEDVTISGDVRYAGITAEEMAKHYRGEVVYNQEEDIHIATLTVAQSLDFALSTKTPGPKGRLPGVTQEEFKHTVRETLLKMLNISHTRNTLVGDQFVRGISGGERKRVSIAEMMATRARVQCWDNSTRGLDASTALDFARSLRIMTDVLGQTTFVTLHQAGENIYELFDKVLVLDKGRQVYFGPPSDARAYFEGLGYRALSRQSTTDYITGCMDPDERQFAAGRSEDNVPSTPEDLEVAFQKSSIYMTSQDSFQVCRLRMEDERMDQEAFRTAVLADKRRGASKRSPYTVGLTGQVKALTIRQFQMRLQDRFQLVTSFGISALLGLIIGGAFFSMPETAAGAFTRAGMIFITILTICLEAFTEVFLQMLGRPVVNKQTLYGFYRPAAVVLANTLADIPFSATRILLFDIIIYFMARLAPSASGFCVFHLFVYLAYLSLQGFFRTLGLLFVSPHSAFRLATFIAASVIQYSGYMTAIFTVKRWLLWIYHLNPFAYGWAGAMENEFVRTSFKCDGSYIVPRNSPGMTKYPDHLGPNQVCTLPGAQPGLDVIPGRDYIRVAYSLDTADMWRRNCIISLGFIVLFLVIQLIIIEFFPLSTTGTPDTIFAKEDAETKRLNFLLRRRKAERGYSKQGSGIVQSEVKELSMETMNDNPSYQQDKVFTWENVTYHVPVADGTRRLLHNVCGYIKPGTLTALMGASGAGKTTCLDVLSQRKNVGVITGDILINGRPLGTDFVRKTAYAEQMDIHEGTATVREAMRFSAYLRQPVEVPIEEKNQYVEDIIELLELQDLSEALVFSLSVEARKRLTIAVELASKPALLLFLDEPTSGLDAQSAWNIVRFLRKLADQGQAILCTIHQPSSLLFENFDRLLLLESGGETVYFGDIGKDSHVVREYFARYGAHCPPYANPAEYMLEAIGAGLSPRIGSRDWMDIWLDSPEYKRLREEIDEIRSQALERPAPAQEKSRSYATSFLYQLRVVVKRNNIALWRSPDYVFSRLSVHALCSLNVSLSFLQLGNNVRDLQSRVFGIFWLGVLPPIIVAQLEPLFISNRNTFIREASSRIYSPYVFAIAQLIGEIPYSILSAIVYWALMVYPMGFGKGAAGQYGNVFQLLITVLMEFFGVSFGQLIAALSPSIHIAVLFNPILGIVLPIFCGVTIPYPTLKPFWRDWAYPLDPYTRSVSAMLSTELHGLPIRCAQNEFVVFNPPTNQTCAEWAGDFVTAFGGYLDDPDATTACHYCHYVVGDEFFLPLNMRFENRWRDALILFSFFVFNFIATIVASRLLRYAKR